MKINDIKNALAAKANSMNIEPVSLPVKETAPAPEPKAEKPVPQPASKATPKKTAPPKESRASKSTATPTDIEEIVSKYLKPGTDYNTIPGCGRKPALLKAGAEKLAAIFNYRSTSRILNRIEQFDQLFVLYEVETTIYDKEGAVIAVGLGSCNSKERKYQRCDFAGNLNTILKMAKKRSYVDAILTACHGSGVFTQDIEDISNNIHSLPEARAVSTENVILQFVQKVV